MADAWVLGANVRVLPGAWPSEGGGREGLGPTGINRNQGAESTLAWLASVETIAALRAKAR